ncbi:MAG: FMN-binding protein MioC [Plesiomonas sp.]|uniref:FMN-binding protein MioC n=1 Tax=Plesiomonas sp. TaxID=2486279 RepID=UPI003F40F575
MKTISVITGSTLGGAEYVAEHLEAQLTQQSITTQVFHGPQWHDVSPNGVWLLICSTHGAGELPDNLQPFLQQLEQQDDLSTLQYGIIGLGSRDYDTFCQAAHTLDQALEQRHAQRIGSRLEIDVSSGVIPEELAEVWLTQWITHF